MYSVIVQGLRIPHSIQAMRIMAVQFILSHGGLLSRTPISLTVMLQITVVLFMFKEGVQTLSEAALSNVPLKELPTPMEVEPFTYSVQIHIFQTLILTTIKLQEVLVEEPFSFWVKGQSLKGPLSMTVSLMKVE